MKNKLNKIINAGAYTAFGIILLKYLPMTLWGANILFDASFHIASTTLVLYFIWYFIDQNESWHIPFFIFSALVLFIVSVQRIIANAHNDVGLLLGFLIAITSIAYVERKKLKNKIKF